MSDAYHEVVVEGPVLFLEGYLAGLLVAKGLSPQEVLFASDVGVSSEGILEQLAEWMHIHGIWSHLIVPPTVYPDVKQGLARATSEFGISLKSDREIRSASMTIEYDCYTREQAQQIGECIQSFADRIRMSDDYKPVKTVDPAAKGVETYTAAHEFEVSAHGTATGSLPAILELRKRAEDIPLLEVGSINLDYFDE